MMTMIGDENEDEIMQAIIDAMEETTEDEWEAIIDRLRKSEKEKRAQNKGKDDTDCQD